MIRLSYWMTAFKGAVLVLVTSLFAFQGMASQVLFDQLRGHWKGVGTVEEYQLSGEWDERALSVRLEIQKTASQRWKSIWRESEKRRGQETLPVRSERVFQIQDDLLLIGNSTHVSPVKSWEIGTRFIEFHWENSRLWEGLPSLWEVTESFELETTGGRSELVYRKNLRRNGALVKVKTLRFQQ
jgi:hypothetical protein